MSRHGLRARTCRSVDGVRSVLGEELVDAIVIGVRRGTVAAAFELAATYPRIPVFAAAAFGPDDGELLEACRRAGFAGFLAEGVDDPAAGEIVTARSASRARSDALGEASRLLRLTEPVQRQAWAEVLARVETRPRTSDIARAVGVTREHLSREFAAGGAPNLKRVIDLARITCAADLLTNPGYDIGTVARVLRYASASHMAGSAMRITGSPPLELARLGARTALLRFVRGRTRSRL